MNHPHLHYELAVDRHRELIAQADAYRLTKQVRATRTPSHARRLWRRLVRRNTGGITSPHRPPAVTPPRAAITTVPRAPQTVERPGDNIGAGRQHHTEPVAAGSR